MNRRGFLTGALGFLAAPAIVRASSLMPVSVVPMMIETQPLILALDTRAIWIAWSEATPLSDWGSTSKTAFTRFAS